MTTIHGGDIVGYQRKYGYAPLDFSANVNPLGLPQGIIDAVRMSVPQADRYPDPHCRNLRERLAEHEQLPADWIMCGNGAADLIYRLVLAERPQRALVLAPTFAEYEQALSLVDCKIYYYELKPNHDFRVDHSIIELLSTLKPDLVFICNPNNPTGLLIDPVLMIKIADCCEQHKIRLIVDECFMGFVAIPEVYTLRASLHKFPSLVVLDAFTKLYAMAGLRLGYILSSDVELLSRVYAAGQSWPVSSLAQAAGIAACAEHDFVISSRQLIIAERMYLISALRQLGIEVLSGQANYLFFKSAILDLALRLEQKGVLIRSCANYRGLDSCYYRIAVRTRTENDQLLVAIAACCQ